MKFFGAFFVFLNTLIFFAHAQNSGKTCEQKFALKGTNCTPCQQSLYKYSTDTTSLKQPPSDKCLVFSIFFYHLLTATPGSNNTLIKALDDTCADTANNACRESHVKEAYSEIDKNCDAELKEYFKVKETTQALNSAYADGRKAESTIQSYYLAIPLRKLLCDKIENEYCLVTLADKKAKATTQSQEDIFNETTCNDCTKRFFGNLKNFQESHPFPNFQNVFSREIKAQDEFAKTCGIPKISDAQKLRSQIAIILIGIIGIIYLSYT